MNIQQKKDKDRTTLTLEGDLTIAVAEKARVDLLDALAGDGPVSLELSGLEDLDITGLQVIGSLLKYCEKNEIDLHCAFPKDGLWPETVEMSGYAELSGEYRTKGVAK